MTEETGKRHSQILSKKKVSDVMSKIRTKIGPTKQRVMKHCLSYLHDFSA